ncbi:hypothetical protein [Xylophilus sp. Leaf220]|uniref:hypothetical protein n=1 Tax=Xylophilus sp. Leaf220 TaxID=1735686 RepID=UPI000A9F2DFC|nr:hypothetical protein [Xylophilus sp. Leaf220]
MKVAKTFVRLGHRYKPGDDVPADLDKETQTHYLRLGMIAEGAAEVAERRQRNKAGTAAAAKQLTQQRTAGTSIGPGGPAITTANVLKPTETKPAGPDETQAGTGSPPGSATDPAPGTAGTGTGADEQKDAGKDAATPSLPLGDLEAAK